MSAFDKIREEYLNEEEMAAILGLAVPSLRNKRCAGRDHPPCTKVGNQILYSLEGFRKWMKSREQSQVNRAS